MSQNGTVAIVEVNESTYLVKHVDSDELDDAQRIENPKERRAAILRVMKAAEVFSSLAGAENRMHAMYEEEPMIEYGSTRIILSREDDTRRGIPRTVIVNAKDMEWLLLTSIRYSLGRLTYAADETATIVLKHIEVLSETMASKMAKEIREHLEREAERYVAGSDIPTRWLNLAEEFEAHSRKGSVSWSVTFRQSTCQSMRPSGNNFFQSGLGGSDEGQGFLGNEGSRSPEARRDGHRLDSPGEDHPHAVGSASVVRYRLPLSHHCDLL
jgi:hypothetical protein